MPRPRVVRQGVDQRCETIDLWFDAKPNAQLVLIWLLDYLQSHADTAIIAKLVLVLVDSSLDGAKMPAKRGGFAPVHCSKALIFAGNVLY